MGDYPHIEYGDLDSDYVFVNLFAELRGQALSYAAVYDLVRRLRKRTGIDFDPHWCRHSAATRMLRDGIPIEVVSRLLGEGAGAAEGLTDHGAADRQAAAEFTDAGIV